MQLLAMLVIGAIAPVARAQSAQCATDLTVSTLVGAGLGGVVAAIPATIVHRHDQNTSHRIVEVSIPAGAVVGFMLAKRDRPCASPPDSVRVAEAVLTRRSSHAGTGALIGGIMGGIAGAVGSTFLNVGCGDRGSCSGSHLEIGIAMAGLGGISGGILGGLIGWAVPAGRADR